jgi:hypothetical protein
MTSKSNRSITQRRSNCSKRRKPYITVYQNKALTHRRARTGASRIFIFDHTIRRQVPGAAGTAAQRGPVQRVHIDQSYAASLSRVAHHLPEEADKLLKGRVQIINVWRPIKTVQRDPLAVADANSVDDKSLVVSELIYPNRKGETYSVTYDSLHK